jgi:ribosome biogenesis GTPase
MRVRIGADETVAARIKGKKLRPVCGDRVTIERIERESDWLIVDILKRRNALNRPNQRGKVEVLAANIDLLVVVAAGTPKPDWFIVDRYLCAAKDMGADALVVQNKLDVAAEADEFLEYRRIGYDTVSCSAATGANIELLRSRLGNRIAIMVGQSGVGKSSLINCLLGDAALRTAAVSDKTSEGRHTTVNSEMLTIPGGGQVIDSPGVRDYAPAIDDSSIVANGFREIGAVSSDCRFANCRHIREPHCAVKSAVESGDISERRFESYRRLYTLTERLTSQQK